MKAIFKYQLQVTDEQEILLPKGARVLSVGNQNEAICLWAMVETGAPLEPRTFLVRGTGHPIDSGDVDRGAYDNFLGTVHLLGGRLIYHVFVV